MLDSVMVEKSLRRIDASDLLTPSGLDKFIVDEQACL